MKIKYAPFLLLALSFSTYADPCLTELSKENTFNVPAGLKKIIDKYVGQKWFSGNWKDIPSAKGMVNMQCPSTPRYPDCSAKSYDDCPHSASIWISSSNITKYEMQRKGIRGDINHCASEFYFALDKSGIYVSDDSYRRIAIDLVIDEKMDASSLDRLAREITEVKNVGRWPNIYNYHNKFFSVGLAPVVYSGQWEGRGTSLNPAPNNSVIRIYLHDSTDSVTACRNKKQSMGDIKKRLLN